ncbi:MAG: hypothetical protein M3071_04375 [Actinomycetota bacterium]|nr:hypothetical protein [Actinomycetota bacterium]
MSDVADALGWYSIPLPELAIDAAAEHDARETLGAMVDAARSERLIR